MLIRRFDREPLTGFVNAQSYLQPGGVELLTPSGTLSVVPYSDIKVVCFVKDFDSAEPDQERKVFNTRPKTDGLWVRMQLRDGEVLDGIEIPNKTNNFYVRIGDHGDGPGWRQQLHALRLEVSLRVHEAGQRFPVETADEYLFSGRSGQSDTFRVQFVSNNLADIVSLAQCEKW